MEKIVRITILWAMAALVLAQLSSCEKQDPTIRYQEQMEAALRSVEREDSIFLGIQMGMNNEAFYKHCWELNRQGIFREGMSNTSVSYKIEQGVRFPINMEFYPEFSEAGNIFAMDVEFTYIGWAPWNREMYAETLVPDVVKLYEKWYGKGFIRLDDPKKGAIFVKIDHNRRISIWILNDHKVRARFLDLTVKPEEPLATN